MEKLENYKSGDYKECSINSEKEYKYFAPSLINKNWGWEDMSLTNLLSKADTALAELKGYSSLVPNIDIYIKMHVRIEANKSSKIEGTKTTIEDDFKSIEDILPEKRDDWQEVQNYILAFNYGIEKVKELPLCNRFIKELHEKLLCKGRGENKTPGEFRKSQNWIGGSMPSNAVYVPPIHTELPEYLSDLEKFINNDEIDTPDLVKIAIIHYQFETIHPFLDGNGRIGRLMIPLYLLSKNRLVNSCFYISNYFEKNRTGYYDALTRVRTNNDMIGWIKFFLKGVIEIADNAKEKFAKVLEFVKEIEKYISENDDINSINTRKIVNVLYKEPVFTRNQIVNLTGLSSSTIKNIIVKLVEKNLITETTGYSRNQVFSFDPYIKIFE